MEILVFKMDGFALEPGGFPSEIGGVERIGFEERLDIGIGVFKMGEAFGIKLVLRI